MKQKELAEIAAALASGYPDGDKVGVAQEFQSVVETVLPSLADRALLAIDTGIENATEMWQAIREDSEGLFEAALGKAERVKVIYVSSKFMNNKLIGEMMTEQAQDVARRRKEKGT